MYLIIHKYIVSLVSDMQYGLLLLASVLLAVIWIGAADEAKKGAGAKLQIGIKKRVDNCRTKSRKGDMLSMHYTVSDCKFFPANCRRVSCIWSWCIR